LRTWALDLLRKGHHKAGLFSVSYGELGKVLAELILAWDATSEFARTP
jgi:hypothetical protein